MECEHCGTDTAAGRTYRFYYGPDLGDHQYRRESENQIITTTIRGRTVDGTRDMFICHRCLLAEQHETRYTPFLVVITLMIAVMTPLCALSGLPDHKNEFAILGGVLILAGIIFWLYVIRPQRLIYRAKGDKLERIVKQKEALFKQAGDRFAIRLANPGVEEFDGYFRLMKAEQKARGLICKGGYYFLTRDQYEALSR
jgi:hypothetical protein